MFDLSGMTALVTGASGGLGSSIGKALAGQGARLAVSGSNVEKLERLRQELGSDHVAIACNLADGTAVDRLVPRTSMRRNLPSSEFRCCAKSVRALLPSPVAKYRKPSGPNTMLPP